MSRYKQQTTNDKRLQYMELFNRSLQIQAKLRTNTDELTKYKLKDELKLCLDEAQDMREMSDSRFTLPTFEQLATLLRLMAHRD